MRIVTGTITRGDLKELASHIFVDMIKAVVDIKREILALDADLHADLESLLLENGSEQKDLWGINLYPEILDDSFIEFDSMINVRPAQGNRSRGVEDAHLRNKIIHIVKNKVKQ